MFERFDRAVRCKEGHLFTTIWIPAVSLKALRLAGSRYQKCPVGQHWTTVTRLDPATASATDLAQAASVHDRRLP